MARKRAVGTTGPMRPADAATRNRPGTRPGPGVRSHGFSWFRLSDALARSGPSAGT